MRLKPIHFLSVLFLLCWPAPALANAGTPLMWANMFHLAFGNAIIGWLEGWMLFRFLGAPRMRSILLMVAANYVSMTAGLFGFPWLMNRFGVRLLGDEPLYHVGTLILISVIAAFVVSLIIEWPFCFAALRGGVRRFPQSWKASAAVQTVSYALLIPLYALVSPVSLWTDVELDRSLAFANTSNAWVYFISPNEGDVYRIRPDGTDRERVVESDVNEPEAVLTLRWVAEDARWDLWVTSAHQGFDERLLVQGLPIHPVESFRTLYEQRGAGRDSLRSWGPALDLRPIPPQQRTMQLWMSP